MAFAVKTFRELNFNFLKANVSQLNKIQKTKANKTSRIQ